MELIERQYNLAVKHLQQGENAKSIELFKKIIDIDDGHALAQHYYGLLLIIEGGSQDAAQHMNLALSLEPESKAMRNNHFGIALTTYGRGDITTAFELLEHAAGLLKKDYEIAANLARLYLLSDKVVKAWQLLELVGATSDFYCLYYQAISAKLMGKEKQALQLFTAALRLKPLLESTKRKDAEENSEDKRPAKVLICYANESLPFELHRIKDQIAFSISGGHFNAEILLGDCNICKSELFVSNSKACSIAMAKLSEYDLIINTISDAEVTSGPLEILQKALQDKGLTVINRPKKVLLTSRENIYKKLSGIENLSMAKTWQLAVKEDIESSKDDFLSIEKPFLLRPLGSSTGIGLEKVESDQQIATLLPQMLRQIFNICPFINFKSADHHYRKYRVFVIGGEIFPEHCVVSKHWNVHSSSRLLIMKDQEQYRDEEERFVNDVSSVLSGQQLKAIYAIADELKLDYFGIDFSLTNDDKLLVFEANSGMRVNPDYIGDFPYLKKPIEKIITAFQNLIWSKNITD